jgi:hypothetical protein
MSKSKLEFLRDGKEYPRVTQRLKMDEYNAAFGGDFLEIWLNWSRAFNERVARLESESQRVADMPTRTAEEREAQTAAFDELMPELFELSAERWGCTAEDARAIYEHDIELWRWVNNRSSEMRESYRERRRKNA